MKHIFRIGAAAVAVGWAVHAMAAGGELHIYNWSDYIAKDTVARFEKENGIKVRYDVYDSDETLQAKLLTGKSGYDLVNPSNDFLSKQIQSGVYQKLDRSKLPNWKNLDPALLAKFAASDPGNAYSVPYMWGTTTIGINVDKVKAALGADYPANEWELLYNPKYVSKLKRCGVSVLNSGNDVFPSVLRYIGKSPVSTSLNDYKEAAKTLEAVRPYITRFNSSSYINEMANGELCLALGYSGDLLIANQRAKEAKNGVRIKVIIPKTGATLWANMMAIPKDAKNVEAAHKFLDFIMRPDVVADISNQVFYANANKAATPLVNKAISGDPNVYPNDAIKQVLWTRNVQPADVQRGVTRLWTTVKTGR